MRELAAMPFINYVQIFENRGEMMGASNPHPHCQIWAQSSIPDEVAIESANQAAYLRGNGSCLLCDYLALERTPNHRCENDSFAVLVPFWAVWPFETMVIAKRHLASLADFTTAERAAFADILARSQFVTTTSSRHPFPNSSGLHQRPTDSSDHPEWHFHAHFYPPLLRSATIRKFLVGFEMLAMPQRDQPPNKPPPACEPSPRLTISTVSR